MDVGESTSEQLTDRTRWLRVVREYAGPPLEVMVVATRKGQFCLLIRAWRPFTRQDVVMVLRLAGFNVQGDGSDDGQDGD